MALKSGKRVGKYLAALDPKSQGYTPAGYYLSQNAQYATTTTAILAAMTISTNSEAASLAFRKVLTYIEADIISANDIGFGNVMYRAGAAAQQATYAAYLKSISSQVASYPRANRLSGALGKVLQSGGFFAATAEGISFGNLALLNGSAKHWARLNYGAGAKGGSGANAGVHDIVEGTYIPPYSEFRDQRYGLGTGELYSAKGAARFQSFANTVLAASPRPAFKIPRGFWFSPGSDKVQKPAFTGQASRDQFFQFSAQNRQRAISSVPAIAVGKKFGFEMTDKEINHKLKPYVQLPTITAGIAPHKFLDAGVIALYQGIAQGVDAYVARVTNLAVTQGIGAEAKRLQYGVEVLSKAEIKQIAGSNRGRSVSPSGPAY